MVGRTDDGGRAAAPRRRRLRVWVVPVLALAWGAYDLATHAAITPEDLAAALAGERPPLVVDVRSSAEYASGHVPGAVHVDFWTSASSAERIVELAAGRPIVVSCAHGPRACVASALLALKGVDVTYLAGHMRAWQRAGLPTDR